MNTNTVVTSENVVFTDFDGGEGILVDLNTKKYFTLNETAKLVWKALEEKKTFDQIVGLITNEYEVGLEHATQSVQRIVDRFESYKLVNAR